MTIQYAIIYQKEVLSTQSGPGQHVWVLEYRDETNTNKIDPIMGWYAASNMLPAQVVLRFKTRQEAESYAREQKIDYKVIEPPHVKKPEKKSYLDNFTQ